MTTEAIWLRRVREAKGEVIVEVAGIDKSGVSRIRAHDAPIPRKRLRDFFAACGVEVISAATYEAAKSLAMPEMLGMLASTAERMAAIALASDATDDLLAEWIATADSPTLVTVEASLGEAGLMLVPAEKLAAYRHFAAKRIARKAPVAVTALTSADDAAHADALFHAYQQEGREVPAELRRQFVRLVAASAMDTIQLEPKP